jgi:hypothetical protein
MAIGFPVKANYAAGDILTAAQMNDLSGTLNYMDPTAKGDLFPASSGTALTRLAVGNNGETLVADSSASTGLRYQAPKTNNVIINGNLDWWQRGTTFSSFGSGGTYLADRWTAVQTGTNTNMTVTQDTSVPNTNSKYSIKFQQTTTGATSVTGYNSRQFIEQSNVLPLLGKSCVLSFWYKSNKTGSHGLRIYAAYNTGGGDQTTTFTVNVADTWEYKTIAATAFSTVSAASASPTSPGALVDIGFNCNGTGFTTLSVGDYFQFTQVQLETGNVATQFARAGGTIEEELANCQRYYYRSSATSSGGANYLSPSGVFTGSTSFSIPFMTPVPMKSTPNVLDFSTLWVTDQSSNISVTNVTIDGNATNNCVFINGTIASGGVIYRPAFIRANSSSAAYIGFGAEF